MNAESLLHDGQVDDALRALQDQVRLHPADAKLRVFLFQLLAVAGHWKRALAQLDVVAEMDGAAIPMVRMYQDAVLCEAHRQEVFAGRRQPLVFGAPQPWIAMLLEALRLDGDGKPQAAGELRLQAFEQAPSTAGTIGGATFEWIADMDNRLGPVLEAVLMGRYYWIPFSRVARIELEPPEDLRDLIWMPARITWCNQGQALCLIPVRYSTPDYSAEPRLALARGTEWQELGEGLVAGRGQRMLATDASEYSLLACRGLELVCEFEALADTAGMESPG